MMRQDVALSARLVQAAVDMHGHRDARPIARHLASLLHELIPSADAIAVSRFVRSLDAFAVLGVIGYPHFPSTMLLSSSEECVTEYSAPVVARGAEAVRRFLRTKDAENAGRFTTISNLVKGSHNRTVVGTPIASNSDIIGYIWLDNWTQERVFNHTDIDLLSESAKLSALFLADATEATIFVPGGASKTVTLDNQGFKSHQIQLSERVEDPSTSKSLLTSILTPREAEVMTFVAMGYNSQQIADRLYLSKNTVRVHRSNALKKLGVSSSVAAIAEIRKLGIIS